MNAQSWPHELRHLATQTPRRRRIADPFGIIPAWSNRPGFAFDCHVCGQRFIPAGPGDLLRGASAWEAEAVAIDHVREAHGQPVTPSWEAQ